MSKAGTKTSTDGDEEGWKGFIQNHQQLQSEEIKHHM